MKRGRGVITSKVPISDDLLCQANFNFYDDMSEESRNVKSPSHRKDTYEEEKQGMMPPSIKPKSGTEGFSFFKEVDSLDNQQDMTPKNLMKKSVEMSIKNQSNRFIGRKQMF